MRTANRIVIALAAAGLTGSASYSRSPPDLFVPELAPLAGAICRAPARSHGAPLVRLARMSEKETSRKKTGISPAAPAAAKALPGAAADDGPPLMPQLGDGAMKITTSSELAQAYFNQGYRLAWAFNHDEALRAFREAQRIDPGCAMCFWGEAWVLGPNINVPMEPEANGAALAASRNASRLAASASPPEQALIGAVAARYSPAAGAERQDLDRAYARAMSEVSARFRNDLEAAALYADALMNVSAWDYWQPGGRNPRPVVADLVPTLERILRQNPQHVAAIHLYIHAVEASADPGRAEPYADRLARLAPAAGHLVHMPSHIYFVIGRYKDSLATNLAAIKADEAYIAARSPAGVYPLGYYPHNVHFAMVSAQMGGNSAIVLDTARKLGGLIPAEAAREVLLLQPIKAAPYFAHAQFGETASVMALRDPGGDLPYVQTAWRYARGIAHARDGAIDAAARELAAIERIVKSTDYKPFDAWKIPAKDVGRIAAHVLRARIAQAGNDLERAAHELRAAVKIQDTLPYMEPAYWYYPVRQTLGATLLLQGDARGAREVFGETLARMPNNAWALYGLAQAYKREGSRREAQAVEERFAQRWMGGTPTIELTDL